MSDLGRFGVPVTEGPFGGCQVLREQLVGVIGSIRSHAAMMHGLAFDGVSAPPVSGKPDSRDLLGGEERSPSQ
ncbi:hypothetical protein [Streptomyces swartbergensis]|uniref:hypothetical protein n=1 Tax=Streptomyces swartbergensis TaxID=487165 RepID=UPI00117EF146|nr:hypothetical protein [Streptomyces swartbergensis]